MRAAFFTGLVLACLVPAGALAAAPPPSPRASSRPAASHEPSRTLDDIHIEGEIPVPQVLFITARDQRRFLDFQHSRYLRTSRELAAATPLPTRILLNRVEPTLSKETSR